MQLKKSVGVIMLALIVPQAWGISCSAPGTDAEAAVYYCGGQNPQTQQYDSLTGATYWGNVTVTVKSDYISLDSDNIELTGSNETLINNGSLINSSNGVVVIDGTGSSANTITNNGTIIGTGIPGSPLLYSSLADVALVMRNSVNGSSTLNNNGSIQLPTLPSSDNDNADTIIYVDGGTIAFTNKGQVFGSIYLKNLSGSLNDGNHIINSNSGMIYGNLTLDTLTGITTITNNGTISNNTANASGNNQGTSLRLGNLTVSNLTGTATATITNTGTISGSISLSNLNGTGQINISNTGGTIGGNITVTNSSGSNPVSITNAGSIGGKVDMTGVAAGLGTFIYVSGSRVGGTVSSNSGTLSLSGGGSFNDSAFSAFSGFTQLEIQKGIWTWDNDLPSTQNNFNSFKIDAGASLSITGSTLHADTIVLGDGSSLGLYSFGYPNEVDSGQITTTSSSSTLKLGNATLKAEYNNSSFFNSGTLQVGNQAFTYAFIDTNGYNIEIGADIITGPSLSPTVGFYKEGSGILTLSGHNTDYTGDTHVDEGTLLLAKAQSVSSGSVIIGQNGIYALNFSSENFTFANQLTGSGAFSVDLAGGVFTFGPNMTGFSGNYVINNATVNMNNVVSNVSKDSTLSLASGSKAIIDTTGITINKLTLNGGTLSFANTNNTPDLLTVNTLDASGGGIVDATFEPTVADMAAISNMPLQDQQLVQIVQLVASSSVTGRGTQLTWANPQSGFQQPVTDSKGETALATYRYGAIVTDKGIEADVNLYQLTLSDSDFTISSSGAGSTTWGVLTTGTGNLTLNSAPDQTLVISNSGNSYHGNTIISGNTVQLGGSGALGDTQALIIEPGATLDMQGYSQSIETLTGYSGSILNFNGGSLTISSGGISSGTLQNGGTLTLDGGTLTVNGSNTQFSGDVNLNNTAQATLNASDGLGSKGTITLADGSQLVYSGATGTVYNPLQGKGSISLTQGSNLSFSDSSSTFAGTVSVASGSILSVNDDVQLSGAATLNNNGTVQLEAQDGSAWPFNPSITGSGTVYKTGSGTITLAKSDTQQNWIINGGSLISQGAIGGNITFANSGAGSSFTFEAGGTYQGTLSGSGNVIVQVGLGNVLAFTGANSGFSGNTTVNSGVLSVTSASIGDGTGKITITSGATYSLTADGSYTFTNPLTGSGTLAVNLGSTDSSHTLTFGTDVAKGAFSGTVALGDGAIVLDSTTAGLLGSQATLRLDSGSTAIVSQDTSLNSLQFNGGTVQFNISPGTTPQGPLLVLNSLGLANNADTAGYIVINAAAINISRPLQVSLFAQSENQSQDVIILAEAGTMNPQDVGKQLPVLLNGAQIYTTATSPTATKEAIYDGDNKEVAIATYDYTAVITSSGTGGTLLSLSYDLINLDLINGQILTLTSSAADHILGASLTGSGGILVDASGGTAILTSSESTYTGPTTLTNGITQLNTTNALGKTSTLTLQDATLYLNNNVQQTVSGEIYVDSSSTIGLGPGSSLTIGNGGTIIGYLKDWNGTGTDTSTATTLANLNFAGGTTTIQSSNPSLNANIQIGSATTSATVNITQRDGLGIGSITFGSAGGSVLGLSGVPALDNTLGGSGTVQISAGSTLIGGDNTTFTGTFVISSGAAMSVSGASNLGGASVNIGTGGVLNLMVPASSTDTSSAYGNLSTILSGGGTVNIGMENGTESGGINVALLADNSGFSGSFNVNTGSTLSVTQSTGLGSAQVNLAAGSALILDQVSGTVANTLSGSGTVNLNSAGVVLTGNNAAFSGSFAIDSASVLTVSQANSLGTASIKDDGVLALNLSTGGTLSNTISGSGEIQIGSSVKPVTVTGDSSTFTGTTYVSGILTVDGQLGGVITVGPGGLLQGSGTVGSAATTTTVQSTGVLASGTAGQLTVNGNLVMDAGSILEAEINGPGQYSTVHVTGHADITGATLSIIKYAGNYTAGTNYAVLTADGGIEGTFSKVIGDLSLLFVDLSLVQNGSGISLNVLRNSTGFADIAVTRNEKAVANAIQSMPTDSALYSTIVNMQDAATARRAFAMLSGEAYASAQSYLLDDSHQVRDAAINRLRSATLQDNADGPAAWGQAYGSLGSVDSNGNAAKMTYHQSGVLAGTDSVVGNWRVGAVGGYGQSRLKVDTYNSRTDMNTYHLGVYGGTSVDALNIRVGGAYSWNGVKAKRNPDVAGQSLNNSADYHAHTLQAFAEVGYTLDAGPVSVEPLLNVAYVRTSTDAFRESGSSLSALQAQSNNQSVVFSTLGAKISKVFSVNATDVALEANLGWRHAAGDTGPTARLHFTGSQDFTVAGVPIAGNVAVLGLGASVKVSKNTDIALNYAGQLAKSARENSVQANVVWKF